MALPKILFGLGAFLLVLIVSIQVLGGFGNDIDDNPSSLFSSIGALKASWQGNIQKRLRQSERLWQESVDKRHSMYFSYADTAKSMFPCVDVASYWASPFSIWDFFPASYNCPHEMERLGRLGDGGKWTCGMSRYETASRNRPCVVYSFGVQYESSFEEEILRRTECEVFGIDFSVVEFGEQLSGLTSEQRSRAHFRQVGIAGNTDRVHDPPFFSIQDLMKTNGHEYIDVLKMDIEGYEFDSMASLMQEFRDGPIPIGQFMVEIHLDASLSGDQVDFPYFLKWWENLEKGGLRPVWTEPNLLYVTLNVQNDNVMPRFSEYTFINVHEPRNILLLD